MATCKIYPMAFLKIHAILIFFFCTIQLSAQETLRVISLAPSLTKNIYYLEANKQLIGCTSYCTEALADGKEIVASAIKVNVEKCLSLKPDLIMATGITPTETIEFFRKLGLKVQVFETPRNFDEICDQIVQMGKLLNCEPKAKEIAEQAKNKTASLKAKLNKADQPAIFFQIGADPIFTVLSNTFMNDYITMAGGTNIAQELEHGTMTRESVLVKNPAYIFIVTMGLTGEEEKKTWEQFEELKACKDKRIFIIDADKACSPTPPTFVETFETIVEMMNTTP